MNMAEYSFSWKLFSCGCSHSLINKVLSRPVASLQHPKSPRCLNTKMSGGDVFVRCRMAATPQCRKFKWPSWPTPTSLKSSLEGNDRSKLPCIWAISIRCRSAAAPQLRRFNWPMWTTTSLKSSLEGNDRAKLESDWATFIRCRMAAMGRINCKSGGPEESAATTSARGGEVNQLRTTSSASVVLCSLSVLSTLTPFFLQQ